MYYDSLEEMYERYAHMTNQWFSVAIIDVDYAFDIMEQTSHNDELFLIETALSEYEAYRSTINPDTAEPTPAWQISVERITELLES